MQKRLLDSKNVYPNTIGRFSPSEPILNSPQTFDIYRRQKTSVRRKRNIHSSETANSDTCDGWENVAGSFERRRHPECLSSSRCQQPRVNRSRWKILETSKIDTNNSNNNNKNEIKATYRVASKSCETNTIVISICWSIQTIHTVGFSLKIHRCAPRSKRIQKLSTWTHHTDR